MKKLFLIINLLACVVSFAQSSEEIKNFKWNTKIFYDDEGKEVKEKSATQYILVNLSNNSIPQGTAKRFSLPKEIQLWEGKYFIFNRNEPFKSKMQGTCFWYHKNKEVARESNFKDGVLDGKTIFYDEGGKKTYSGNYKNGKLDGGRMIQYEDEGETSKIYMQNFDGFYDSWDEEKGSDGQSYFDNGYLWIKSLGKDGYTRKEYMAIDTKNDFSIETGMKFYSAESCFIFYGHKDFQNYHGVEINNKGYLRLLHFYEGINIEKKDWYKIGISNKSNVLKILRMGENVFISFNGNVVTSYKFHKMYGNYFGYYIPKKSQQVGISYIRTKEFSYLTRNDGGKNENDSRRQTAASGKTTTKKEVSNTDLDEESWKAAGTGFYVASNGLIITNYHVIDNADNIGITQFVNGRKTVLKAKIILTDAQNDIALLQVDDDKFVSPGIIPYTIKSDVADVGESIFTMGYPLSSILGDEIKITDGIISARSGMQGDSKMYQISAAITYGNSGGPLFDKEGNLLGMNTSGITMKNLAENTGYSIKTSMILNLLQSSNDEVKIENRNLLKGKPLKEQVKQLRNFVPMICVQ